MFRRLLLTLLAAWLASAESTTVSVLATTDLHGNIYPYDYYTARPADRGLAKIASLIEAARRENPNTLLIDCGDTIQGTPLETVYQSFVRNGRLPLGLVFPGQPLRQDPMMLAMNRLGYRAMVLGNHEFNFGLKNLEQARLDARFPWLSANTVVESGARVRAFEPFLVETVGGVKLAVIGATTPAVPWWEKPENYRGYRFLPMRPAVAGALAALRSKHAPDVVIGAIHAGLGGSEENSVEEIASGVAGLDAIVFGHTHQQVEERRIGDVILTQPRQWGGSLARLDFTLERAPGGRWRVAAKRARLIPVTTQTPADQEILRLARPYHEVTERYLDSPVAQAPVALEGSAGRIRDSALVDAIQAVQMHYTQADVSFTALFNPRVVIPAGPVSVRQIAALYIYDNELYAIQGTGRMVREALENSARYFLSCHDQACGEGPLVSREFIGFNYDMAQGVDYEIDLRRPAGDRIRNLRFRGAPLEDDRKLRLAVNNYRAAGSGGYTMFRDAKILWKSDREIRDLIVEYYSQRKTLPAEADGNWRIVPPAALATLEREIRREPGPR